MNWDFSVVWTNLLPLFMALWVTIKITVLSILIGTALGVLLGVGHFSNKSGVRWLSKGIVEIFLALPVLVIIIWLYFCLPLISNYLLMSGESASICGLGLSLSAFVAQIVKAGINVVPYGQLEVAYTTGLTQYQAVRHILLPQALRQMWAPLLGQYITCYKMSTLASVVAVQEVLHTGSIIIAQTYRPLEIYTAIALIFLLTLLPVNYLLHKLERPSKLGGTEIF
jgi:polar amino acid transport system permease protein